MTKRLLMLAIMLCMLAVAVSGCGNGEGSSGGARTPTYSDDLGREVKIEKTPQRIVSISPACTEILFALGLGDEVVGDTEYCDYPQEAKEKPKVGTFKTPNLEAILALSPDLVLATGGLQEDMLDRMEEHGLTVFAVNPLSFDQTLAIILKIGELTGTSARAEDIVADMSKRAVDIARRLNEIEAQGRERPRAFYEIFYENNVWTAGSDSIVSDLIRLAGGENIGDADTSDYYEFSMERLFVENPQVYLVGVGSMSKPGDISARSGWDRIDAVKNGRIYFIEDDLVYRTGPRLIEGLETVHDALYP